MTNSFETCLKEFLASIADVPDVEFAHAATLFSLRELRRGDRFIDAGATPNEAGLVVSGLLKMQGTTVRGDHYVVAFPTAGMLAADYVAAIGGRPATLTIEALEPSVLAVIPLSALDGLLMRHSAWQSVLRRMLELQLERLARREQEFLTLSATERYEELLRRDRATVLRVPRQDLAAYLGITPVSLSRLASQLLSNRRDLGRDRLQG